MASSGISVENIGGTNLKERWAITPVEYWVPVRQADGTVKSEKVDFQDLMVNIAQQRAGILEAEVEPLSKRIKARNAKLEQIGMALSQLSNVSAQFKSDETNPSVEKVTFKDTTIAIFKEVYAIAGVTPPDDLTKTGEHSVSKASVDEVTQKLKTWSERLNNDSQLNMSRMQTLVSNRDQSYNTATTMMNHISDARGFTIKSMN